MFSKFGLFTASMILLMAIPFQSNAQLGKLIGGMGKKKKKDKTETTTEEVTKKEAPTFSDVHQKNIGKVVFFSHLEFKQTSDKDDESKIISEYDLGQPLYARAYFDGDGYDEGGTCDNCNMNVRYTIGDKSFSANELRAMDFAIHAGAASSAYYAPTKYAAGFHMNSGAGAYYSKYNVQEDAFRFLLSHVADKLLLGTTVTVKVEVLAVKDYKDVEGKVIAVGEIPIKIGEYSTESTNMNCRCRKPGMDNAEVEKEIKEAFMARFEGVEKVHKTIITDRDYKVITSYGTPTKRELTACLIWEEKGIFWMARHTYYFSYDGSGYSKVANVGKYQFKLPVSPTCAIGDK